MNCEQVRKLLAGLVLGCLDAEDEAALSQHLAHCEDCHRQLDAWECTVGYLALAAPQAEPPPGLKSELMRRINRPTGVARHVAGASHRRGGFFPWLRPTPAWVLAGLVLVCVLSVGKLFLWQRTGLENSRSPASLQMVVMEGTAAAPIADGTLVYLPGQHEGVLVVSDLPALEKQQQYQLWLIKNSTRTSGGSFWVEPNGYARFTVHSQRPLDSYTAFGITIEPAGGSPAPTGEKVLSSL